MQKYQIYQGYCRRLCLVLFYPGCRYIKESMYTW